MKSDGNKMGTIIGLFRILYQKPCEKMKQRV